MRSKLLTALVALMVVVGSFAACSSEKAPVATDEPTAEATVEATVEASADATVEATVEATADAE